MAPKKQPRKTLGRTAKFYRDNPKANKKKDKYNTEFNKKKEQVDKRADLKGKRAKAKKAGKNIDNLDYDHKTGRFISPKKNRGAKEKSRLKGSKRTYKITRQSNSK